MTESDQIENVLLLIELVNDAVITNAKPILGSAFQPMVRIGAQACTEIVDLPLE